MDLLNGIQTLIHKNKSIGKSENTVFRFLYADNYKYTLLNNLREKFKAIKLNSNVKQIEIKETIIKNEEDLSNALNKYMHDKYSDIDILIRYVNKPIIKLEDIGINRGDILGIKLENNDDSYVVRLLEKMELDMI